jgi:hypothetical protein
VSYLYELQLYLQNLGYWSRLATPVKIGMITIEGPNANQVVYKNTFLDKNGTPRRSPINGGFTVLTITSSPAYGEANAYLTFPRQLDASMVIVGGGGGGGSFGYVTGSPFNFMSGGGGGGGVYIGSSTFNTNTKYSFYVGKGGIGNNGSGIGNNGTGESSQLATTIAGGLAGWVSSVSSGADESGDSSSRTHTHTTHTRSK